MGKIIEERGMKVVINRDEQPMLVHCWRGSEKVTINLIGSKVTSLKVTSSATVTLAKKLVEENYLKLLNEWHRLNP